MTPTQQTVQGAAATQPSPRTGGAGLGRGLAAIASVLDIVVVVVAAVPAIALGAPALGYLIGAAGWLVQRALQHADSRLISRAEQPRQLGLNLFESFGRIWLLAGAIVIAGVVGGRADGLTAAVVIFAAYSIAFAMRVAQGRPGGERP